MGFLKRDNLRQSYEQIKRGAVNRICSILILVAPTIDGLCALKIMTDLFKADFLPYKVIPVAGYQDIVAANDSFIQGRHDIKSVILIECGATVDLAEYLSLSIDMTIYLLDSHRPYSLENIFLSSQVVVLDDGFIEANRLELEQAFEATKLPPPSSQYPSDPEGNPEGDEQESDVESEEDDRNADSREDENRNPNPKGLKGLSTSKSSAKSIASNRRYEEECRRKLRDYYSEGSWYGAAAARLVFDISDAQCRSCNDHLWCAILGVTSKQILELSSMEGYEAEVSWLRERCLHLNRESLGEKRSADSVAPLVNRDGLIKYEPEFRFMLTRHWTLYASMMHSRYMATRLGIWRERGRRLLETFIVKMGIPVAQCKLDYGSMEMELKESLPARISKHAAEFGVGEVYFPSFTRDYGYVTRLSASDAVYSLMALIEAPYSAQELKALASSSQLQDNSPTWVKNFYFAFEALEFRNIEKLKKGIQLAMRQQQVVLHEATTILSHRQLRYGRKFRYIVLRHSNDLAWLSSHPLSLTKLALFLAEATKDSKRGHTPLLLAAYQSTSDTYLVVVSIPPLSQSSSTDSNVPDTVEFNRNRFGNAFRRAAQSMRARVKHDGFESAMIEIASQDLKPFIQTLQNIPIY